MKRFLIGYALLATCLLFMQKSMIDEQEKLLLVYHADNKYAITGKVTEKRKIGSLFTITVNGNVFVVSEEQYKNIEVGKEVEI
jgi:HAMP domain-containing protein